MNFYPQQLRQIADMLDALDAAAEKGSDDTEVGVSIAFKVPVTLDGAVAGHAIDEIGGSYSFDPLTPSGT